MKFAKSWAKEAEGGFGVVFLVYDRYAATQWALKTFRDKFLANAARRELFRREATILVDLEQHPFILPARWVHECSGQLFVVMDYVAPDQQGRISLLDHMMTSGRLLPLERILEWSIQCCYGMEHVLIPERRIQAHTDLKPANLLIHQGTSRITDFGPAAGVKPILGKEMPGDRG